MYITPHKRWSQGTYITQREINEIRAQLEKVHNIPIHLSYYQWAECTLTGEITSLWYCVTFYRADERPPAN